MLHICQKQAKKQVPMATTEQTPKCKAKGSGAQLVRCVAGYPLQFRTSWLVITSQVHDNQS